MSATIEEYGEEQGGGQDPAIDSNDRLPVTQSLQSLSTSMDTVWWPPDCTDRSTLLWLSPASGQSTLCTRRGAGQPDWLHLLQISSQPPFPLKHDPICMALWVPTRPCPPTKTAGAPFLVSLPRSLVTSGQLSISVSVHRKAEVIAHGSQAACADPARR